MTICCQPYKTARHTATCPTVVHAPLALSDDGSLSACGIVGPISQKRAEVTCDTCLGRPAKPGWDTYPGALGPLTARQYERALEQARLWLGPDRSGDEEPWRVWNRLNAQHEGGVTAFLNAIENVWK